MSVAPPRPSLHDGRDFCLFCSLLCPQHLEGCLVHNRRSVNTAQRYGEIRKNDAFLATEGILPVHFEPRSRQSLFEPRKIRQEITLRAGFSQTLQGVGTSRVLTLRRALAQDGYSAPSTPLRRKKSPWKFLRNDPGAGRDSFLDYERLSAAFSRGRAGAFPGPLLFPSARRSPSRLRDLHGDAVRAPQQEALGDAAWRSETPESPASTWWM